MSSQMLVYLYIVLHQLVYTYLSENTSPSFMLIHLFPNLDFWPDLNF